MQVNIGDRVRLLHGKEEGIVMKISGQIVEIEIEEGFILPVQLHEVVKIAEHELTYFKKAAAPSDVIQPRVPQAEKGIFLAFLPIHAERIVVYVINNTDYTLPFTLVNEKGKQEVGVLVGTLTPKSFQKSLKEWKISDFEQWGNFVFTALYYREGSFTPKAPLQVVVRGKAKSFFAKKKTIPLVQESGYVYQLDDMAVQALNLQPALVATALQENQTSEDVEQVGITPSVLDLHLEKIVPPNQVVPSQEALGFQLKYFQRHLDMGIAQGLTEMTFIHGVGNGVLKQEIQRILSKHPQVAWFQEAQKEKFGYGALKVALK